MNLPEEEFLDMSLSIPSLEKVDEESYDFEANDIHASMIGMVPLLVERARQAPKSGKSFSYRGFLVGAAALAYDVTPDNPRIGIYSAGNYKAKLRDDERTQEDIEDIPKFCAEMDINMRASMDDFQRIGIIVVAATTNREKIKAVTELAGVTLEPCEECENVMQHSDLIDPQTIIMTIGSGDDRYQVQSFANLSRRYEALRNGSTPQPLKVRPYSLSAWEQRQSRYIEARDSEGIDVSSYARRKRDEKRCSELALQAMSNN